MESELRREALYWCLRKSNCSVVEAIRFKVEPNELMSVDYKCIQSSVRIRLGRCSCFVVVPSSELMVVDHASRVEVS